MHGLTVLQADRRSCKDHIGSCLSSSTYVRLKENLTNLKCSLNRRRHLQELSTAGAQSFYRSGYRDKHNNYPRWDSILGHSTVLTGALPLQMKDLFRTYVQTTPHKTRRTGLNEDEDFPCVRVITFWAL